MTSRSRWCLTAVVLGAGVTLAGCWYDGLGDDWRAEDAGTTNGNARHPCWPAKQSECELCAVNSCPGAYQQCFSDVTCREKCTGSLGVPLGACLDYCVDAGSCVRKPNGAGWQ